MKDWKFKCKKCQKYWITQSTASRYILSQWWNMTRALRGVLYKTICYACQGFNKYNPIRNSRWWTSWDVDVWHNKYPVELLRRRAKLKKQLEECDLLFCIE